jgi:hypothetical protein
MHAPLISILLVGTLCWSAGAAHAAAVASAAAPDEIIVRGRGYAELRLQIRRAEQSVYDRFNAINSDDRFDVTCDSRERLGSRMHEYVCQSNSWREQDANIGAATARALRGEFGADPAQFVGEQLRMQRALRDEMNRLAESDPELRRAVMALGEAYQMHANLTGARSAWSYYREMPRRDDGLPFDAERALEVQIGATPWSQALLARTFTFGDVTGKIRGIEVDCERHRERLPYEAGTDWTIPDAWGACLLRVDAKRDTTFRLYEFQ